MCRRRSLSSSSYFLSVWIAIAATVLAESTGDVVFGFLLRRHREHRVGAIELYQPAHVQESREVGDARRLLHVVRDDRDRVVVLSSWINSSIRAVAIGSSAEHGSSIRITSGSTARARAMHKRCCCRQTAPGRSRRDGHAPPPTRPPDGGCAPRSRSGDRAPSRRASVVQRRRCRKRTFGNGLGFWNTMPTRRLSSTRSGVWSVDVEVPHVHRPAQPQRRRRPRDAVHD